MKYLFPLVLALCGVVSSASHALEFTAREDFLPRLQELVFVYPPADPVHYDALSHRPVPEIGPPASDRPKVIHLSGQINKGDADRFIAFMEANWFYGQKFILDSPGGNFLEALKIGSWLVNQQDPAASDPPVFDFYVLEGDKCLSACALILAMGGGVGNAMIEQGATVGFHMGILPDEQAERTAKVRDVMNLTYDIVLEYTRLIEDGWQSPLLLRESLRHRTSDSFFYLRGGMRSWQMGFDPVARPNASPTVNLVGLDHGAAIRVCSALLFASRDRLSESAGFMVDSYGDRVPQMPDAAVRLKDIFDGLGSDHITLAFPFESFYVGQCSLSRSSNGDVSVGLIDPELGGSYAPKPECLNSKQMLGWCATREPAPTHPLTVPLLADSLGCSGGTLLRTVPEDTYNWQPNWLVRSEGRRGIAKREVNIRAVPGLGTSPIGTLAKGASAEITNCALTGDKQGVFFQIKSGSTQGWVSARFLIEEGLFAVPVTN